MLQCSSYPWTAGNLITPIHITHGDNYIRGTWSDAAGPKSIFYIGKELQDHRVQPRNGTQRSWFTGSVSKQRCMRVNGLSNIWRRNQAVITRNSKGKIHVQVCSNLLFCGFFLFSHNRDKEPELQMGKTRRLVRMVRVDFISGWRILSKTEPKYFLLQ